jgi:hypothetical protein
LSYPRTETDCFKEGLHFLHASPSQQSQVLSSFLSWKIIANTPNGGPTSLISSKKGNSLGRGEFQCPRTFLRSILSTDLVGMMIKHTLRSIPRNGLNSSFHSSQFLTSKVSLWMLSPMNKSAISMSWSPDTSLPPAHRLLLLHLLGSNHLHLTGWSRESNDNQHHHPLSRGRRIPSHRADGPGEELAGCLLKMGKMGREQGTLPLLLSDRVDGA